MFLKIQLYSFDIFTYSTNSRGDRFKKNGRWRGFSITICAMSNKNTLNYIISATFGWNMLIFLFSSFVLYFLNFGLDKRSPTESSVHPAVALCFC